MSKAAIYLRRSREEREDGYSLPAQRRKALERAEEEGWEVVDVIEDDGESGGDIYRPGWGQVIQLARTGQIDVVLAAKRDRLFRSRRDRLNTEFELDQYGVGLVALNDTGNRFGDAIQDEFAEWELEQIKERLHGGIWDMIRGGEIKAGPKPPYGFCFDETGKMLVVYEPEMAVLRRIFREMAAGTSAGEMIRRLDSDGILSPSGLGRWNKKSIAHFLASALYEPRTVGEFAGMVAPDLLEGLDSERVYGLWIWNRRKTTTRKEWDGERVIKRYSSKQNSPEDWLRVPVDITGADLDRGQIERAREQAKDRYRKPSKAAGRFWQLRGIAYCGECGAVLSPHTVGRIRADGSRPKTFYYQCRRRFNTGPKDCDHTRSYPAPNLEEDVFQAVLALISNPERVKRRLEANMEHKRKKLSADPARQVEGLIEQLVKLQEERRGFLRQNARGVISDEELDAELKRIEREHQETEKELGRVRNGYRDLEELERNAQLTRALAEHLEPMSYMVASPQDRHRLYKALSLKATVNAKGEVTLRGLLDPNVPLVNAIQDGPDMGPRPTPQGRHIEVDFVDSRNTH